MTKPWEIIKRPVLRGGLEMAKGFLNGIDVELEMKNLSDAEKESLFQLLGEVREIATHLKSDLWNAGMNK